MAKNKEWTKTMAGDQLLSPGDIIQLMDQGAPVTCRVLAQAEDFQPVGEQQVLVTASPRKIIDVDLVLTTLRRATGVVIKGCAVA